MAAERNVKGMDIMDLVKNLKRWRIKTGKEIPGLHPDDLGYFEHSRVIPGQWYPLESWLRLLSLTCDLVFAGTTKGMLEMGRLSAEKTYTGPHASALKHGDGLATLQSFVRSVPLHHTFGEWKVASRGDKHAELHIDDYPEMTEVHGMLCVGWFEVMLAMAGLRLRHHAIHQAPWRGGSTYVLELKWTQA